MPTRSALFFFFQAEDGIRDSETLLEFRRVLFRSVLLAVMLTPGMTPPVVSLTVPEMLPPTCAEATEETVKNPAITKNALDMDRKRTNDVIDAEPITAIRRERSAERSVGSH